MGRRVGGWLVPSAVALVVSGMAGPLIAQDLEPRAYSASPVGMTFLVLAAGRSTGGVVVDPSLPIDDVEARLGVATVGIGHTFGLATRTAAFLAAFPYARVRASGQVGEDAREVSRTGWADARFKLSVNLLGGRALRAREFAAAPRGTIVGTSLTVGAPLGQYSPARLINLGSNRWSYKPEVGVSVPVGRWTLDAYGGAWFFTTNDSFYPGTVRREQNPIVTIQGHASYTVKPRLWVAFNATWYSGGRTSLDGVDKADLQRNSRLGATISLPVGRSQSIKVAYSAGATTRIGGDFRTLGVAWQMAWLRP